MSTAPKRYRPVSVIALVSNLPGCAACLSDVRISTDDVAQMTAARQALTPALLASMATGRP